MTIKGSIDSKRLLNRSQCFDMLDCKKISAMLPISWKKSFNIGIVIPVEKRRCNERKGEILCDDCNNQINEKKFRSELKFYKKTYS